MDRAKVIEGGRGTGSGRVCSGGELGQAGSRGRGGVLGQLHHPPDGMYAVVAEQSVLVATCVLEVEERRALHGLPVSGSACHTLPTLTADIRATVSRPSDESSKSRSLWIKYLHHQPPPPPQRLAVGLHGVK